MTGKMSVPQTQGGLEEDARLTALFLWTLQSTNGEAASSNGANESEEDETDDEDEGETPPKGKAKGYTLVFDVVAVSLSLSALTFPGGKIESSRLRRAWFVSFPSLNERSNCSGRKE